MVCGLSVMGMAQVSERAAAFAQAGQWDSADRYLELAVSQALEQRDRDAWIDAVTDVGRQYLKRNPQRALEHYMHYLDEAREQFGERDVLTAELYSRVGDVYRKPALAKWHISLDYMEKALRIYADVNDRSVYVAYVYFFAGSTCTRIGNFEKAESHLVQASQLWTEAGDMNHAAHATVDLGVVYLDQGRYEEALTACNRVLTMMEGQEGRSADRLRALALLNRADCLMRMNDLHQAEHELKLALHLFQDLKHERGIASVYQSLGELHAKRDDSEKALELYERVLATRENYYGPHHREIAKVHVAVADVYLDLEQWDDALAAAQRALESLIPELNALANPTSEQLYAEPWLMIALQHKAEAVLGRYESEGAHQDLDWAMRTVLLASEQMDLLRDSYSYAEDKRLLFSHFRELFHLGVEISERMYIHTGDEAYVNQAFAFMEKGKSYSFLEMFQGVEAQSQVGVPDSLVLAERDLQVRLQRLKGQMDKAREDGLADTLSGTWVQTQQEYERLKDALRVSYPAYYRLKYEDDPLAIQDIRQSVIEPQTALLEFTRTRTTLYTLLITHSETRLFTITTDSSLEERIVQLTGQLSQARFEADSYHLFLRDARFLYEVLFADALAFCRENNPGVQRLVIVPDGLLGYLPMEVLLTREVENHETMGYRDLPYLMQDYSLAYAFSATTWMYQQRQTYVPHVQQAVIYAPEFDASAGLPPLEHATEEALAIGTLMDALVFTGPEVSKTAFLDYSEQGDILHFATHAEMDVEHPLFSRLYFRGSGGEEVLHTHELFAQPLDANLAVLSACNTGSGRYLPGEGIMSLGKGFAYAGCPSVVMSLWPVNSSATSDIMQEFYRGIRSGMDKDRALQNAQQHYLDQADAAHAHPFFWAGFVVQGNTEALYPKRSMIESGSMWIALAAVAVFVLLIVLFRRRSV